MEVMFSVESGKLVQQEFRSIVAMPSSIQSSKLVCIHPAGDLDGKICHRLNYISTPLKALLSLMITRIWTSIYKNYFIRNTTSPIAGKRVIRSAWAVTSGAWTAFWSIWTPGGMHLHFNFSCCDKLNWTEFFKSEFSILLYYSTISLIINCYVNHKYIFSWLDGLNTPTEVFACLVEVIFCVAAFFVSIVIFSKCIVPLFRCVHSISRPPKKK